MDYFTEHIPSGGAPGTGSLAGRALKEPQPYLKDIAGYVSQLIKDGDTLQIGVGRATEPLVRLGLLNDKHDLGWHSEATPPGVISAVGDGEITGRFKTLYPGKVIVPSLGGGSLEEINVSKNNPLFWLIDVDHLYRTVSLNDNMIAINNALAVDLTGQIAAETMGYQILAGSGGQPPFVYGALLSKGGRSVTVLPSTAKTKEGGAVSRIVTTHRPGTVVTIPRVMADIVVSEYGIARLRGRSLRQRAEELIAIAHPDFRAELNKEARRLFWP